MEIRHDKKIDTKYFKIKEGKTLRTQEVTDWLLLDYDKNDEVLGLEVLQASKNLVSISTVNGQFSFASVMKLFNPKPSLPNINMSAETSKEKLIERNDNPILASA